MSELQFSSLQAAYQYLLSRYQQEHFTEVEGLCRRTLAQIPDLVPFLLLLAATLVRTNRTPLALAVLDKVLALEPDHPLARGNRDRLAADLPAFQRPLPAMPAAPARPLITVLLCGQVRDRWFFSEIIRHIIMMRESGLIDRIVFSSWKSEFERLGHLVERLKFYGVELVENEEPENFQVAGNYFQQTSQLYAGLQAIDSESWVFKTRPDVYLTLDNLRPLFDAVIGLPPVSVQPRVFEHRVWAPYFEVTQPFFISDVVFFGRRNDLLKLCSFDSFYEAMKVFSFPEPLELQKRAAAAETRKFLPVFAANFPLLNEYRETWQYAEYYMTARDKVIEYNFNHPLYREYFALSLYIMHTYFIIGRPAYEGEIRIVREVTERQGTNFNSTGSQHFVNTVDEDKFYESIFLVRNRAGQVFCNTSRWLDNIFNNNISDEYLDFYLRQPLQSALAYRNTPERRQRFLDYRETLRQMTAGSARLPLPEL